MLRDYQVKAIDETRAHITAGRRRPLIVAPTGAGKTTIASAIIHSALSRGSKIVFMAHRRELINQPSARLDALGVDHGIIMGDHWRAPLLSKIELRN